jgi:hypothetical protein
MSVRWLCAWHRRHCVHQPPRCPPALPYSMSSSASDVRTWERGAPLLLALPMLAVPSFSLLQSRRPPSPRSSNARSRGRAWGCETPRAPFFLRSSRWSLPRWRRRAWIDSRRATSSPLLGARGRQRRGIQKQHRPAPYLLSAPLPLDRDGGEARTPRGGR